MHAAPNPPVARLAEAMSEISERCWYAGWLKDTEFVLWSAFLHGPMPWGHGEITAADIHALRELSEAAGGWVRWSDEEPEDHVFVNRETWRRLFLEWEMAEQPRRRIKIPRKANAKTARSVRSSAAKSGHTEPGKC